MPALAETRPEPRARRATAGELRILVERVRQGDKDAFGDLVRATSSDLYGLALRMVGNEHDARDVMQEAYLRAYRSLGGFRGESAIGTWLYRITANCASNHLSRRGRWRHDGYEESLPVPDERPSADPEAMAALSLERTRLTAALAALPAKLRTVVVLRDIYDLPHEAIAVELGISETAAKVRLHRARKKLRERLMPQDPREVSGAL